VVLAEERTRAGIDDFSTRIVCQVFGTSDGRKGVIVKYNILLVPASQHTLAEIPESKYAGWPGLACHEGSFPMDPRPTVAWKCPIVPFVRPGIPYAELQMAPPEGRPRIYMAAIMRRVNQPDILNTGGAVAAKWERLRANPRELLFTQPTTSRPPAPDFATPPDSRGKIPIQSVFLHVSALLRC
jgi:hypothetical protein